MKDNTEFSRFDLEKYVDRKMVITLIKLVDNHIPTIRTGHVYIDYITRYNKPAKRLVTYKIYPLEYTITIINTILLRDSHKQIVRDRWLVILNILKKIKEENYEPNVITRMDN